MAGASAAMWFEAAPELAKCGGTTCCTSVSETAAKEWQISRRGYWPSATGWRPAIQPRDDLRPLGRASGPRGSTATTRFVRIVDRDGRRAIDLTGVAGRSTHDR
jgi:hypothetical protein